MTGTVEGVVWAHLPDTVQDELRAQDAEIAHLRAENERLRTAARQLIENDDPAVCGYLVDELNAATSDSEGRQR
jgi:type II secretory pathway component PulF